MAAHAFHIQSKVAKDFIEEMGIDHTMVTSIKIEMAVGCLTTIEVVYLMEDEAIENLTNKYILTLEELP